MEIIILLAVTMANTVLLTIGAIKKDKPLFFTSIFVFVAIMCLILSLMRF